MHLSIVRNSPVVLAAHLFLCGLSPAHSALIHEWHFNETSGTVLEDSVGNADAEIVLQGGFISHQRIDGGVRLDGGNRNLADYIRLPADVFDGLTNVTIEIWAAPHSFPNWGRVLDISPGDNPTVNNLRLSFSVGTDGNQQRFGVRPFDPVDSALPTALDRMYLYTIVWSATGGTDGGGRASWYRNGALVAAVDTGGTNISTLANLPQTIITLGRSAATADEIANATFYAVRIYDRPLDEVAILANVLKGPDNTGPDNVEGLVNRWSFSESEGLVLLDSVGGRNGSIIVQEEADHVLANSQVQLTGGSRAAADYIEMPAGLLDGISNVTIEVWATPQSAQNWSRLFDFGAGNDATAGTFFLSLARGTSLNQQRLEFDSPAQFTVDTGLTTTPGQPYHYVVTWGATNGTDGGGRLEWYRDGVFIGGVDTGSTTAQDVDDSVLWLGRSQYAADATANADFDEVRIYNRVLTPAEINFNRINGPDNFNIPPPTAVPDSMTLNPGAMALIPVLNNDLGTGLQASTVQIVSPPAFGSATVKSDGKVLYTHDGSPGNSDAFTYTVQNSIGKTSNVATVTLNIDPSLRLPNTTMTIPDTPPPVGFQIVDAFPGLPFEDAVAIRTPIGMPNHLFVCERRGIISYIPDVTSQNPVRKVMLNIANQVRFDNTVEGEMGLIGMEFHPGFITNGHFYVYYVTPAGGSQFSNRLARFTADPGTLTVDTNTQQVLFSVWDQQFNHNGGDLHFGPDGYLYVGMGDEGEQYNRMQNAQRIDRDFYSGLLRIDVDKRPGNLEPTPHYGIPTDNNGKAFYSIPADNPFLGVTNVAGRSVNTNALRGEFYAIGFRHPWRFSFDANGELWVPDVGQDRYEEINIVTAGGNYGWAFYEGIQHSTAVLYPNQITVTTNLPPPDLTSIDPIYEYVHTGVAGGNPQFKGNSVTGGYVYRGSRIPELHGAYVFADFVSGHIWALWRTNSTVAVERIAGESGIAAFGIDPSNGDLLLANYFQNRLRRIVRTDAVVSTYPSRLSDAGIFADLDTLTPNPGIVSYEPIVAFWSDHAVKQRWFSIPDLTNRIAFAREENWSFPSGMKWIKHFDLELERGNPETKRRLETRVLVRNDSGTYGVSYMWNEAGTEAFLVGDAGTNFTLTVQDGTNVIQQMWEIPSRSACLQCHTPFAGHALSFNTRELNQTASMNGMVSNQIALLEAAGYFAAPVPDIHTLPAFAAADDSNHSLEYRVRSYLSVNCVQCHQAGGTGPTWDARAYLTLKETGLLDAVPGNNGGDPQNRLVVPGDVEHSLLLKRIAGDGFQRMPPLATHQLDQKAIDLVAAWISTELTNRLTFEQWQIANFGSTNNPSAAPNADPDGDGAINQLEFLTGGDPLGSGDAWSVAISTGLGAVSVSYLQVPNLGVIIESSSDLLNWSAWNVPGNQPIFGLIPATRIIHGPVENQQFFRARVIEP